MEHFLAVQFWLLGPIHQAVALSRSQGTRQCLPEDRIDLVLCMQRRETPKSAQTHLLPRDASAERGDEIACRPSVCMSVRNV